MPKVSEYTLQEMDAEIKAEVINRELARRSLGPFQTYVHKPWFKPGKVHELTSRFGNDWLHGKIDYLMLLMPPRHGKTQTNTEDVTAFGLGKFPNWEFMVTSYSKDLAREFGRHILETIKSPPWKNLFPDRRLSDVSHAADEFSLSYPHRGKVVATGRGGAQTGKGWNRGIIDDPTKDWEEAISARFREKAWDWVRSTFLTRAMSGEDVFPALMVNMTHWHEDDIAGRFIKELGTVEEGGMWTVVRLPMEAEEEPEDEEERKRYFSIAPGRDYSLIKYGGWRKKGDALWEERYPVNPPEDRPHAINAVVNIKKTMGPKIYSALYMQRPTMDVGNEIKRTWFNLRWGKLSDLPPMEFLWGEIDTSLKSGPVNDRSAFIICGLGKNGLIYGLKGVAGHLDGNEIKETIFSLQEEFDALFPGNNPEKPYLLKGQYIEDAAIAPAILLSLRRDYSIRLFPDKVRRHSKLADVRNAAIFAARGMFVPPANEPWWDEIFLPEILAFGPNGSTSGFDDCTDVWSRAILRVTGRVRLPGMAEEKKRKREKVIRKNINPITGY